MEVFGLGVRIKEEGAATVETALNKLQKQFTATTKAANDFAKAINKIGTASGTLRQVINDLDATATTAGRLNVAQNNLAGSARNVRDALAQKVVVTGRATQAQASLESSLIRSAKQFAATTLSVTGIVMAIRQLVMTSDEMMLLEGRINLVANSTANLRELQDKLYESAQKTRSSYAGTSELYARVARNSDQLGYSQEQLLQFSELTQMSIRTSGINAIEASRGMIQLSQALASGVLRGDEFRAVMEQMPGTARAIAEGLGVPIGTLREMANAGDLTAKLVMDAILKMSKSIRADFDELPVTIGDGFTRIRNAFQKAIVDANRTTNATNALGESLSDLAKELQGPLTDAFAGFANLAKELVPVFGFIGQAVNFIADNIENIKATIIAFGGILVAVFRVRILGAIGLTSLAFRNLAAGIITSFAIGGPVGGALVIFQGLMTGVAATARAMWVAIGGPVGLAIIAVTTGYALWKREINLTTEALKQSNEEIERANRLMDSYVVKRVQQMGGAKLTAEEARRLLAYQASLNAPQRRRINLGVGTREDADAKTRNELLVEYNSLLEFAQRDLAVLRKIEVELQATLSRSNLTLVDKIKFTRQLLDVQKLLRNDNELNIRQYREQFLELQNLLPTQEVDLITLKEIEEDLQLQLQQTNLTLAQRIDILRTLKTVSDAFARVEAEAKIDPFKDLNATQQSFADFEKTVIELARKTNKSINEILYLEFSQTLATTLRDGLAAGIEAAIATGNISNLWRALSQTIIANISKMMANIALTYIRFGTMMAKIQELLMTNPLAAVAVAAAMLAFASANGGKPSMGNTTIAGGAGGLQYGIAGSATPPVQQIIFGATSATTAAGMQPRQAMNVTVIGPNDPSAQRAIQELMTKANSRGRIG